MRITKKTKSIIGIALVVSAVDVIVGLCIADNKKAVTMLAVAQCIAGVALLIRSGRKIPATVPSGKYTDSATEQHNSFSEEELAMIHAAIRDELSGTDTVTAGN